MKAKVLHLKQAITIPGTKILGAVSILPEKHPTAVMEVGDHGVLIKDHGIDTFVPMGNVLSIILSDEEESGRSKQTAKKS